MDHRIFSLRLDYGQPELIAALVNKGGPWGYLNPAITDANYPVKGEGVVDVKYRILHGKELKRADGLVHDADVDAAFVREGMRRPNVAEALLVPAEDHQIGCRKHSLVMFIQGLRVAFQIFSEQYVVQRCLRVYRVSGRDVWLPEFDFLGVCE